MRVLLLSNHLNPGGLSRYIVNLCQGLVHSGHQVWVASNGGTWEVRISQARGTHIGLRMRTKCFLSPKVFQTARLLSECIRRQDIDVIHANTRVTQFLAWLLSRKTGIPYVTTFHGFYRKHLFRRIFPMEGEQVIAISNAVKEDSTGSFGISPRKISVVYHGIDIQPFAQIPLGRIPGKPACVLGILSRLSAEKAIDTIIELFPSLLSMFPAGLELRVAGSGKLEQQFKERVAALQLHKQITFCGVVDPVDFFSRIDVLLFPSRQEGLGFSVLEAKAAGKVVIASTAGGLKEIIADGTDGFLLEQFTAGALAGILERLSRAEEFYAFAQKARQSVSMYTIPRMAEQTSAVYESARKTYEKDPCCQR